MAARRKGISSSYGKLHKYGVTDGWMVTGAKNRTTARKRAKDLAKGQKNVGGVKVVTMSGKGKRGYRVLEDWVYNPKTKDVKSRIRRRR